MGDRERFATDLARPVDLSGHWNASDGDLAATLHPLYAPAIRRFPAGRAVLRGLPFLLGSRGSSGWLLLSGDVVVGIPDAGAATWLVVAHFCDSWRDELGARPDGLPVGWVLGTGDVLARYALTGTAGTREVTVRRRFEVGDGITGWGYLPFRAVGHRVDEPLDFRGPHARQVPGRIAPAGHAGPLTTLPGAWGPDQTGVADFVPMPDDDITLWLHSIPLEGLGSLTRVDLRPTAGTVPGQQVVVAGLTLFRGAADPLLLTPRVELLVTGAPDDPPEVDLGVAIRTREIADSGDESRTAVIGWGSAVDGRSAGTPVARARILDVTMTPDARLRIGSSEFRARDIGAGAAQGVVTIRPLPERSVRTQVSVTVDGTGTPSRVRFVAADGRYLPPVAHRDEVNTGLYEDNGGDLSLAGATYAYVPETFDIDLPLGEVIVEVVRGFDCRPVRRRLVVDGTAHPVEIGLERALAVAEEGWVSADSHVHFLAPSTALLQAAAEDVNLVHLLATQWGDEFTNITDLAWGSMRDPDGRHAVIVGTENRQNMLGHLALLGARRPVLPPAAGGGPEGGIGGAVTDLLGEWAERCRSAGGLVVGAHFPLPYAEVAAAIVAGLIDGVEMQTFAPGLDTPPILEWYRFLNCGSRLPVLGGTDKMTAEVPVGAVRTFARVGPNAPVSFDTFAAAVRAGRTFATSGPVIALEVDGHEPGDVVGLPAGGGRMEATILARAAQPVITAVELVVNGRVVGARGAPEGVTELRLTESLEIDGGAWIAARSRSGDEIRSAFATSMASHTSPVYVEVPGQPLFVADDAAAILRVIDGTLEWLESMAAIRTPALRAQMRARIELAAQPLRRRYEATRPG